LFEYTFLLQGRPMTKKVDRISLPRGVSVGANGDVLG